MGFDFDTDLNFDLTPIDTTHVNKNIYAMLIPGEQVVDAFKTVRDQVVFTNKRILSVDVKGITGKKQFISSMPYKMVQYFTVQTVGFAEVIPDAELEVFFANGHKAHFEFRGKCKITEIAKDLGKYCLDLE